MNNKRIKRLIVSLFRDAVHRVHPLAGQGVNLGFGDVVVLRNALRDNILNGSDVGSFTYLKNYESTRQKEAFVKAAGIDLLNRLYTDYNYPVKTPLVVLRSVGLTLSNRIAPLKNFFIKQAMQ